MSIARAAVALPTLGALVLLSCGRTGLDSTAIDWHEDAGEAAASLPAACPPTTAPIQLARTAKSSAGFQLAVSPTHVYWWDAYKNVHRVPKCGGPPELVTTGLYYVSGLAFRWGTLFVADSVGMPRSSGRILAVGDGTTRVAADHIDSGPSGIATDDRSLYFLSGPPHSNSLLRLDWPSETTTVVTANVYRFLVGGPYLYLFRPPNVLALPLGGGSVIPLDDRGVEPLAADESGVYYADTKTGAPAIWHVAVGSSPELWMPSARLSVPFGAVDATRLYLPTRTTEGTFPNETSKGLVLAVSKSTKEVSVFASTPTGAFIEAIATDDSSVYWIEYDEGRLMKLDK